MYALLLHRAMSILPNRSRMYNKAKENQSIEETGRVYKYAKRT